MKLADAIGAIDALIALREETIEAFRAKQAKQWLVDRLVAAIEGANDANDAAEKRPSALASPRIESALVAIDGNIADLAGAVRELSAVLRAERHGYFWGEGSARTPGLTIEALPDVAGKAKPEKRTRKRK